MAEGERKYWFHSKYGFGWYPVTIRGGIVFLLYFAFLIYIFFRIDSNSHSVSDTLIGFAPFIIGATIILLFICYLTGEPLKVSKLKI